MIKEITDIATECGAWFQVEDRGFEDGSVKVHSYNGVEFLDVKECLKFAKYRKELWEKDQVIESLNTAEARHILEIQKLQDKDTEWKSCFETWKMTTTKSANRCTALENERDLLCSSLGKCHSTISSLRSKLGQANRKLRKVK